MESKTLHPHRIGLAGPAEGGYGKIDLQAGDAKFCRKIVGPQTEPVYSGPKRTLDLVAIAVEP